MFKYLLCVGLIVGVSCKEKEPVITIVDIGYLDRVGIANQLSIINRYSPKVIGLNVLFTSDSSHKDSDLLREIAKAKNLVQASALHDFIDILNEWDSLEMNVPKFRTRYFGFGNVTVSEDSVFVPEVPMKQFYNGKAVPALSYVIADRSFGVDTEYRRNSHKTYRFESKFKRFKIISVDDLRSGNFEANDLNNKIVLMGSISDRETLFYLDEDKKERISGVEMQAFFLDQIISDP